MKDKPIEESLSFLLVQLVRAHHHRIGGTLRELGLYVGQEMIMSQLWEKEGVAQSELADACGLSVALPTAAQNATLKIVSSVAADAFSRGSEIPVTPSDPTLFYRAASEMLCENVAPQVVDAAGNEPKDQLRRKGPRKKPRVP